MTAAITVHLVRHAESVWNVERRHQGQADSGLTECGRRQAQQLGLTLSHQVPAPDVVISSDLSRARETAAPFAARIGVAVRTSAAFREVDVGDWAGRTFAEMAAAHPETMAALSAGEDRARGGGETFAQVRDRCVAGLAVVLDELRGAGADRTVAVFTHGGPIRLAVAAALGIPTPGHRGLASPDNCSVTTVVHRVGRPAELVRYNHVPTADGAERRDSAHPTTDGQIP